MSIFLLIYDRRLRRANVTEYSEADRGRASADRYAAELANLRNGGDQEIVILEAASLKDIRRTHAAYFETIASLADRATRLLKESA